MVIMKDLIKKLGSRGRMDAENRWWVSELLAADCEKALIHTGCEDTLQKWYHWLEDMKKKDEKEEMEEMHQKKVEQMIKSAEGSAGLLHKVTRPTPWSGGAQILKKGEEDVKFLDRCEAKRKEWSIHWQCNEQVQNTQDKPWRNDELRRWEEALARLNESELGKGIKKVQGKDRSGMRRLPSQSSFGLDKRNEWRNCGIYGESGAEWQVAATSMHNDVLPDSEECHELEADCADADVDTLVGSYEGL